MNSRNPIVVIKEAIGQAESNTVLTQARADDLALANFKTDYVDGEWRYSFVFTKEVKEEVEQATAPKTPELTVVEGGKDNA